MLVESAWTSSEGPSMLAQDASMSSEGASMLVEGHRSPSRGRHGMNAVAGRALRGSLPRGRLHR